MMQDVSTRETETRIAIAKAAFNKKKALSDNKLYLNSTKKPVKILHLERSFVWCWNLDTSESRSEIPGKL